MPERLCVLRGQEEPNTEVTEVLRGLCVEDLEARRTRRILFRLRLPSGAAGSDRRAGGCRGTIQNRPSPTEGLIMSIKTIHLTRTFTVEHT